MNTSSRPLKLRSQGASQTLLRLSEDSHWMRGREDVRRGYVGPLMRGKAEEPRKDPPIRFLWLEQASCSRSSSQRPSVQENNTPRDPIGLGRAEVRTQPDADHTTFVEQRRHKEASVPTPPSSTNPCLSSALARIFASHWPGYRRQ